MIDYSSEFSRDGRLEAASPPPGQTRDTGTPFGEQLTPREALVMNLIQQGLSTRLAARRLEVRPRTVDKHVERALRKLGARSRIEAIAILRAREGSRAIATDQDRQTR